MSSPFPPQFQDLYFSPYKVSFVASIFVIEQLAAFSKAADRSAPGKVDGAADEAADDAAADDEAPSIDLIGLCAANQKVILVELVLLTFWQSPSFHRDCHVMRAAIIIKVNDQDKLDLMKSCDKVVNKFQQLHWLNFMERSEF